MVNVLHKCNCNGMFPDCARCEGFEVFEVIQTARLPWGFDFSALKFEAIAGLFQVFMIENELIGAGNICYEPEENCFYVYEMQSFWGEEGHRIMVETMLLQPGIPVIKGNYSWEDCYK